MSKIIVIGSANTDFTVRVDRLPRPGETVAGGEFMVSFGGKGANQALAALKSGAGVLFLAKIGTDDLGERLCRHLVQSGIPEEGLLRDTRTPAGIALIAVDSGGRNQIVVASGSNARFSASDLHPLKPRLKGAALLLAQLEIPIETVQEALRLAKADGAATILNPAPFAPLPKGIYRAVDILTPNEGEAAALTGIPVDGLSGAAEAAAALHARGCPTVILTLGGQGAFLSHRGKTTHFPAFPVKPVDSVAAGDAFNGALAAALAEGAPIEDAIRFANAAGALSTLKRGAQESLPARQEIETLLKRGSDAL